MEYKKKSLIITTIAIMIIDIIVFIFNLGQNVSGVGNVIFCIKIIFAILSILLIRNNLDRFKYIILVMYILFVLTGNIIALYNIVTILKLKK